MNSFEYTVTEKEGLHARPVSILVKEAKRYESKITIVNGARKAEATKMMMLMGMGVKCGDTIEVQIEGPDEEKATKEMQKFFKENL